MQILKEVQFLASLSHPNIVRYFHAWQEWGNSYMATDIDSESDDDESLASQESKQPTAGRMACQDVEILNGDR
jgi:serine/threonine protein kinase